MKLKVRFAKPIDFKICKPFDSGITGSKFSEKAIGKEIFLATIDGSVVGYLRIEFIWLKIPYISWIFVDKKHRNNGVASELVEFLRLCLAKKQYKFILSSFQSNAIKSKRWHSKIGFRRCGKIQDINEDESDEIFCQLKI